MDVPDLVSVLPVDFVETMDEPGAKRSVSAFLFENEDIASAFVVEDTEIDLLIHAGAVMFVVYPEFPEAMTTETLLFHAVLISEESDAQSESHAELQEPPPKLMEMTEILYLEALLVHQFTASVISEKRASPAESATFTATMLASGATPVIEEPFPAAIPVTCVPCP